MMKPNNLQTNNSASKEAIQKVLRLSYDPQSLQDYYNTWAAKYNDDVSKECYQGPAYIVQYFSALHSQEMDLNPRASDIKILDAGCGTGLVGMALHQKGYRNIDGFDLSPKMVEETRKLNVYNNLIAGCDMTKKIPAYKDNQYDATICCGVFTTGHVPPSSLKELIRITRSGGLVVVSTRKSYYDTSDFQSTCVSLQQENTVKLVSSVMESPYLEEENAHYWAFVVGYSASQLDEVQIIK